MKKILTIAMVALIAMTTVFATAGVDKQAGKTSATGTAEVTFTLGSADIEGASAGFVTEAPTGIDADKKDVTKGFGTAKTSIALKYDNTTATASNSESEVWFAYKIKALAAPTITLTGTKLNNGSKDIDYTVSASDTVGEITGDIDTASKEEGFTLTPSLSAGYASGYGKLTITTQALDASYVSDQAYKGTLTLTVAGV